VLRASPPGADAPRDAVTIDVAQPPPAVVAAIRTRLGL
jgi:hypothetical protein